VCGGATEVKSLKDSTYLPINTTSIEPSLNPIPNFIPASSGWTVDGTDLSELFPYAPLFRKHT
jgi:hypothetical protein